ncbi:hypothetical protein EJB05_38544, partial [Eragrostis curvula]
LERGSDMEETGRARAEQCILLSPPTDFGSHSMLHQTLIPSFPSSASSSSPFLHANNAATAPAPAPCSSSSFLRGTTAMPSYAIHHHSPMDGRMDAMNCSGFPPEETAEEAATALVERDGFSVEDLLDLEEFGEADKDGAEHEDAPPPPAAPAAEEAVKEEKSSDDSQPSSIVTYELPPPPPEMVDLPAHDVEELEWVSRIMDDSLSELPPPPQPLAVMAPSQAPRPPLAQQRRPYDAGAYRALPPPGPGPQRTPIICALSTEAMVPVKAKRSKRSRAAAWSLSGGAPLFSDSTSSSSTTTTSSCSSSSAASFSPFFLLESPPPPPFGSPDFEGYHPHFLPPPPSSKKSKHGKNGGKPKKRGRKPKHQPHLLTGAAAASAAASQAIQGDRAAATAACRRPRSGARGPRAPRRCAMRAASATSPAGSSPSTARRAARRS